MLINERLFFPWLFLESSLSSQPFDPVQFRVLLHQRLIEMHKDKYPVLPFLNAAAMHRLEGGLDLTVGNAMSRGHSDNDDDYFEEEEEEDMEVCAVNWISFRRYCEFVTITVSILFAGKHCQ